MQNQFSGDLCKRLVFSIPHLSKFQAPSKRVLRKNLFKGNKVGVGRENGGGWKGATHPRIG